MYPFMKVKAQDHSKTINDPFRMCTDMMDNNGEVKMSMRLIGEPASGTIRLTSRFITHTLHLSTSSKQVEAIVS